MNKIDHLVVSLFTEIHGMSVLKFGSFDHEAIANDTIPFENTVFPTINQKSWAVRSTAASVTSVSGNGQLYDSIRYFEIDP
jgi:hypothetical protein